MGALAISMTDPVIGGRCQAQCPPGSICDLLRCEAPRFDCIIRLIAPSRAAPVESVIAPGSHANDGSPFDGIHLR